MKINEKYKNEIDNFIEIYSNKSTWKNVVEIFEYVHIRTFYENQFIYIQDSPPEYFYLVLTGQVELSRSTNLDTKRIFAIITPGDMFGHGELFDTTHSLSAICISECLIGIISKKDFFDDLLKIYPFVFDVMSQLSAGVNALVKSAVIDNSRLKISNYLLWLKKYSTKEKDDKYYIKKNLTHQKISEILFLSRETVSRVLNNLKKENIIDMDDENIIIINEDKLNEISNGELHIGYYGTNKK